MDKALLDEVDRRVAALREVMDERDRRYTERDAARQTAIDAALKSAETLTSSTFAASEKAISKAEANADKWRENANEWRTAMNDRETKFAPRIEIENRLKGLEEKIAELRETWSGSTGSTRGAQTFKEDRRASIGMVIGVAGFCLAVATTLFALLK